MVTLFSQEKVSEIHDFNLAKYSHEKGRAEGHAEGHAEGREEGRAEGQKELARTLLEKGVSKELIASSLNVAVNEIEEYLK